MKNSQVAHTWAHGQAATGSNFYSPDGVILYSYGGHFPCGERVREGQFLVTSRGYSSSTAKHLNYTRQAVYGDVITCDPDEWNNLRKLTPAEFTAEAKKRKEDAEKAREAAEAKRSALRAARLDQSPVAVARREKSRAARERAKARKAEEARAEALAIVEAWRGGENPVNRYRVSFCDLIGGCALRIKGDQIETSGGASVPLSHARHIWREIRTRRDNPAARFGDFKGIAWDGDVAVIGCHRIPFAEFERLARQLGLIEAEGVAA